MVHPRQEVDTRERRFRFADRRTAFIVDGIEHGFRAIEVVQLRQGGVSIGLGLRSDVTRLDIQGVNKIPISSGLM